MANAEVSAEVKTKMSKSKLLSTISEEDRRKVIFNLEKDFVDIEEFESEDFKKRFDAAWQVLAS